MNYSNAIKSIPSTIECPTKIFSNTVTDAVFELDKIEKMTIAFKRTVNTARSISNMTEFG